MLNKEAQFDALNNAIRSSGFQCLELHTKYNEDKRKTVPVFFLTNEGKGISPVLDFDKMNHFILGMIRAKEILTNNL